MSKIYTKELLIQHLQELGKELGRRPNLNDCNKPSSGTYYNHFESFKEALELSGYDTSYYKYSKQELIRHILAKAEELGRTPTLHEVSYLKPIRNQFGSYDDALRAAGLLPNRRQTNNEMISALKAYIDEKGYVPSFVECMKDRIIDPQNYHYRFGNWNKALKKAGIKPLFEPAPVTISKEVFYNDYIALCNEYKMLLNSKEIDILFKDRCSAASVRTWFGGMLKLKEYAILDPRLVFTPEPIKYRDYKYSKKQIDDLLLRYSEKYGQCSTRILKERLKEYDITLSTINTALDIRYIHELWNYIAELKK